MFDLVLSVVLVVLATAFAVASVWANHHNRSLNSATKAQAERKERSFRQRVSDLLGDLYSRIDNLENLLRRAREEARSQRALYDTERRLRQVVSQAYHELEDRAKACARDLVRAKRAARHEALEFIALDARLGQCRMLLTSTKEQLVDMAAHCARLQRKLREANLNSVRRQRTLRREIRTLRDRIAYLEGLTQPIQALEERPYLEEIQDRVEQLTRRSHTRYSKKGERNGWKEHRRTQYRVR